MRSARFGGVVLGIAARAGVLALAAVVTLTSLAASEGRAEAQGTGAGGSLELKSLGVKVKVPSDAGEWTVRKDGADVLQRTRPVNPFLSVIFEQTQVAGAACGPLLADYAKKGFKRAKRTDLAPAGWAPQVLAAASGNGDLVVVLCAAAGDTLLVALVTYGAQIDDPDLGGMVPMLGAVGLAVFAKAKADSGKAGGSNGKAGGSDAKAGGSDANAGGSGSDAKAGGSTSGGAGAGTDAMAGDAPTAKQPTPSRLNLTQSGLVVVVTNQRASWRTIDAETGHDLIVRTRPAEPGLSVRVEIEPGKHTDDGCEVLLTNHVTGDDRGALEPRPPWLPDEWFEQAAVSYKNGVGRALVCAPISTGYLLATVIYDGSLDSEDVGAVMPLLAGLVAAGTRAEPPRRGRQALIGGHTMMSPEAFLSGQRWSRDRAGTEPSLGIMAGVRQAALVPLGGSPIGLTGRYLFSFGWDADNDLVFDGYLGFGLGINIVDRVWLIAVAGGGGDGVGVGNDEAAMEFELWNYYAGGTLTVDFGNRAGVELGFGHVDRGDQTETRIDARLMVIPRAFRKVSLAFSYVDLTGGAGVDSATTYGLQAGIGF